MRLDWSASALADLSRFAQFLNWHHPDLAGRVADEIARKVAILTEHPHLGRPIAGQEHFRELVLKALNARYVIEYRIREDRLTILRIYHGREMRDPVAK